jgi:small subunit ribosomal protein S1
METLVMTEELNMEQLLAQTENTQTGSIVEGTVISQTETHLVINVGLKQDAFLPLQELAPPYPASGSTLPVLVLKMSSPEGHPLVSFKKARELKNWDSVEARFKNNELIEGTPIKKVKGGLIVDIGMDAFLPASQIDLKPVNKPEDYIGKPLKLFILEMDKIKRNVLVSRRKHLENERIHTRTVTLENMKEGLLLEGTVTGLTNFGAFIDIGGIEGLLHVSDMAWTRVDNPKTIVKVGDRLSVKVLKYDATTHKISLGRKQLLPHPWEGLEKRFPIGCVTKGKVTGIAAFGAFVQIEPGIDGLIHMSELTWTDRAKNPKDILKKGQDVEVKIIAIDRVQEKISLSLKRAGSNPWEAIKAKYPKGSVIEGEISHLATFGAFVKIEEGFEGLLKTQDISWTERVSLQQMFKVGDKIKAVVLDVNPDEEKMALGTKQLNADPFRTLKIGQAVNGTVSKVISNGVFVKLDSGLEGFVRYSELHLQKSIFSEPGQRNSAPSDEKANFPNVGDAVSATVTRLDKKDRKIDLSIRRFEQGQEKELLKKYSGQNSKLTLGEATGWTDEQEA